MNNKTGIWKEVNFSDFCDSFYGSYKNNFSYSGKKALYDYLVELSESMGEVIELDTIALCSEWDEYENFDDIKETYDSIKDLEDLQNNTQVIEFDGGIIIQSF